jgi:anti-sigma factor ChrR (cupin superfamily)
MNVPRLVFPDLIQLAKHPETPWQILRPGVDIHRIYGDPDAGPSAALLRYAPGASVPRHEHPGNEHIFVLEGAQTDDTGTYAAGCFVVNPPGTSHTVTSPGGCLVLIIWNQPVRFA